MLKIVYMGFQEGVVYLTRDKVILNNYGSGTIFGKTVRGVMHFLVIKHYSLGNGAVKLYAELGLCLTSNPTYD